MRSSAPFLLSMLLAASALAQSTPATPPAPAAAAAPADDPALQKELEQALQKDTADGKGKAQKVPAAATAAPSDVAPASAPASTQSRGFQSLNPDVSGILDANGGYERRGVAYRNGDDPDLKGGPNSKGAGFTAQEVELALSAIVDPYFKGEIYLTIPNLSGLEVEEAFATTTSLPGNFQIKAGTFRSAFGRQNGQHLHIQDFTRRPLINAAFLGTDGLRGPGAQVSWLTPLPFYLVLYAEAFSLPTPDVGGPVASFGGGSATDLTYVGEAKLFVPASDEVSISAGLSSATGVSPGLQTPDPTAVLNGAGANRRSELFGGDLYVKWKPLNVSQSYFALGWQTEAIFRHLAAGNGLADEWDGGLYSQVTVQVARRWVLGVRGDVVGLPVSSVMPRVYRAGGSVTFQASEFARVRLYGEVENIGSAKPVSYLPDSLGAASPASSFATYLQLEFSIGAHGAHPF